MEIRPGFSRPIIRQLQNTTETDTYYVRAVIRETLTGTVIKTVDLTDEGSYRFKYNWTVPSYSNETYIDISTTVYIDSGYTQISGYYGTTNETDVIRGQSFGGAGGGIGYGDIEKIVRQEIAKIKIPEQKKVDLSKIEKDIALLMKAINDKPITEKTDIKPILDELKRLDLAVKGIKMPITDLTNTTEAIKQATGAISDLKEAINDDNEKKSGVLAQMQAILDKMKPFFFDQMDELMSKVDSMKKAYRKVDVLITKPLKDYEDEDNS